MLRPTLPLLLITALLSACSSPSASSHKAPPTVKQVDLNRYMGEWYVIANIPYSLEKGKVASSDTYQMRADGKMDNIYTFREKTFDAPEKQWKGVAWVVDKETNATWKVRLFWPLTSTYLVLHLDPDYRWSVVGTPNGKLLWILAKSRSLPEHEYQDILELLKKDGYDIGKIEKVPQPADVQS